MKEGWVGLFGLLVFPERDKSHGMSNILKLFPADFIEAFASAGELFIDLNRLFGHLLVGLLSASDEPEILTGGNPLVTVRVKAESQEHFPRGALAFILAIAHGQMVACSAVQGQARAGERWNSLSFKK